MLTKNLFLKVRTLVIALVLLAGPPLIAGEFYDLESYTSVGYLRSGPNRLGDTLTLYATYKWSCFHLNIPLFYDPFEYSNQLMISEEDYSTAVFDLPEKDRFSNYPFYELRFQKQVIKPQCYINGKLEKGYLSGPMINEMKKDHGFMELIRRVIAPKEKLRFVHQPGGRISVAVHMRRGSGFDGALASKQIIDPKFIPDSTVVKQIPITLGFDYTHPLKAPPEQYFIDQIRDLAALLGYPPMYVYIFTDDPNPVALMNRVQQVVDLPNIVFDCRRGENLHDENVLIDLFSMSQFDCLIHPGQSAFSLIAHLIGDHRVVIYPTTYSWVEDYLKMEDIQVDLN